MNKDKSLTFRLALFAFGAFIILAGMMMIHIPLTASWNNRFIWISAFLIYVAAWIPFLLPLFRSDNINSLFTAGSVYWKGLGLYITASIALMSAAATGFLPNKWLIIGQLAALFILALTFYLSWSSSEHTAKVAEHEQKKTETLNEIKNTAKNLSVTAGSMSEISESVKEKVSKAANEIRYISPSDDKKANDFEIQIKNLLAEVEYGLNRYTADSEKHVLNDLDQILLLCRQRKNIY